MSSSFVYFLFVCQGIALLMPWNSLLTNSMYYETRLKGFEAAQTIWPFFAVIFMSVKLLFMIFSSFVIHLVSPERQIVICGLGNTVVFLGLTLLALDESGLDHATYFALTLILAFLASICCAFLNNALYTILGRYSPKHTQAISNGQGVAGIIPIIVKIILVINLRATTITSLEACLTYAFSTLVIGACSFLFIYYQSSSTSTLVCVDLDDEKQQQLEEKESIDSKANVEHASGFKLFKWYLRVYAEVKWYAWSVLLIYLVTLGLFPLFYFKTSSVHLGDKSVSEAAKFYYEELFGLVGLLLFNIGDWIGKLAPLVPALILRNRHVLFFASLARFIYIPFFFFGNGSDSGKPYCMPKALANDGLFYFIALTFGITNGYLSTLAMMNGPPAVAQPKDRTKSATVMVFFLTVGLTAGAYLSLLFSQTIFSAKK